MKKKHWQEQMNASTQALSIPDRRMHFCIRRNGARNITIGPFVMDENATVPVCFIKVVRKHPNKEMEFPSSFSGVKYQWV